MLIKENLDDLSKSELIKLIKNLRDELAEQETQINNLNAGGAIIDGNVKAATVVGRNQIIGLNGEQVAQLLNSLEVKDSKAVTQILSIYADWQEELREWKEIHNDLNEIIIVEGPFIKMVVGIRHSRIIPHLFELRNQWFDVTKKIEALLYSAKTIKYVGKPFEINDTSGELIGELWAVDLYKFSKEIERSLNSKTGWMERFMFRFFKVEPNWWRDLDEYSGKFDKSVNHHMHQVDKNLKSVAEKLDGLTMQLKSRGNHEL